MGILTKTQDYDPVNTIAVIKRTKDDSETGGAVHFIEGDEHLDKNPETEAESEIRATDDFYFSTLPRNPFERQFVTYCAGKKGCGKTTNMAKWMFNYKQLTGNPVFLISSKESDQTIDEYVGEDNINRISTDEFDDPETMPQLSDFENCLVCFDDFMNDNNTKNILHLMNQIAERGRQPKVSMFTIFHNITNSHKTKLILTEADYFIIFPSNLSNHNYRYFMQNYGSISDKKTLKKIRKESGKAVLISVEPKYVVCSQCIFVPLHG